MKANPLTETFRTYDTNLTRQANGSYVLSNVGGPSTFNRKTASYVNNKGWNRKKPNSWPVSSYDVTWNTIDSLSIGYARAYDTNGVLLQSSDRNFAPSFGLLPFISSVDNDALGKYRQKLTSASGSFKSLVPLAESRELRGLVNTMADSVPTVLHSITDLRHGRIKDAFSRASDLWLAWSFGFSPLMEDAKGLANAIASRIEKPSFVRIHGSSESSSVVDATNPFDEGVGAYTTSSTTIVIKQTCRSTYIGTYDTSVGSGVNYRTAADNFGISIPELVPVAWELIPYSFVIDYFTNIGDVINDTFSVVPRPSSLINSRKNVCSRHKTRRIVPTAGFIVDANITNELTESGSFSRSLLSALPSRTFSFESFGSIGKIKRVINLAAILAK